MQCSFLSLHCSWTALTTVSISTPRGEAYYELFSSVYTNHTRTLVLDSSNPLITDVTVRPASLHLRRLDKHSFVKPSTREEVFTASPSFRGYGMEGLEANNRIFNRLYRRTYVRLLLRVAESLIVITVEQKVIRHAMRHDFLAVRGSRASS